MKLGYGGTKTEMEHLLEDAEKLKAKNGEVVDYSIDSFADIVEAIHVIQEEMGITGTTAEEADKTIEGSLASTKAAWENLVYGLARDDANISGLVENVVASAQNYANNVIPVIGRAFEGLGEMIGIVVQGIMEGLPQFAEVGMQTISQISTSIGESLPELIPRGLEIVLTLAESIINNLPELVSSAMTLLTGFAEGLIGAIPVLDAKVPEIIVAVVNAILASIPSIIDSGTKLMSSIMNDMPKIIKNAKDKIPKLIKGITGAITEHVPEIIESGKNFMSEFVTDLPEAIKTIVSAIPDVITGITGALAESIPDIIDAGVDLFSALVDNLDTIITNIVGAIPDIISHIKDTFEKHWPEIEDAGLDLITKVGDGISSGIFEATEKVGEFIADVQDILGDLLSYVSGTFESGWSTAWRRISGAFSSVFDSFVDIARTPINSFIGVINGLIDGIESALNTIINGFNMINVTIPDWVPLIGGNWFGINIPNVDFGGVNYLANGGVLGEGEKAVVGEYAPEYLQVVGGKAIVTPMKTGRFGGQNDVTINVFPQKGQSEEEIAKQVERQFTMWQRREGAVFA